jgi:hypothetical protein
MITLTKYGVCYTFKSYSDNAIYGSFTTKEGAMKPREVNLVTSTCPLGTEIEIEGFNRRYKVNVHEITMLAGIASAYTELTGENLDSQFKDGTFLKRVTLTGIDPHHLTLKAQVLDKLPA